MNIIIVILIIITITIIIMTKASPTLSVLVIGLLNVEHLPRLAFSLSSNVLSVACKVKLVRVFIVNVQMRKVQKRRPWGRGTPPRGLRGSQVVSRTWWCRTAGPSQSPPQKKASLKLSWQFFSTHHLPVDPLLQVFFLLEHKPFKGEGAGLCLCKRL